MTQPTPKPPVLAFSKMQGLGNDYVYMEEFDFPLMNPAPLAVRISDRRFGVGGDGLILMGASEKADFRMRVFNADGSEAEMCGNGIRCVGKYLYEKQFTRAKEFTVETPAGIRELRLTVEQGEVRLVRVDMGVPRLAPKDIPMLVEGESFINHKILVGGSYFHGTAVSMGNPHLVVPMPHLEQLNLPELGPLFERHFLFPQRVNTEFVEVRGKDHIAMRVWERGAGETWACGTGACAALVACALNGLTGRKATVSLPGGDLLIEWNADDRIFMTGPATWVFSGEYHVPADL